MATLNPTHRGKMFRASLQKVSLSVAALASLVTISFSLTAGYARAEERNTDLYGEVASDARHGNILYYSKLTETVARPLSWFSAYLGVGVSEDNLTTREYVLNDNYVAPLAGLALRARGWPVFWFGEFRQVVSQVAPSSEQRSDQEFRSGIVATSTVPFLFFRGSRSSLFSDLYAESVYSSRLENNVFSDVSEKVGFQKIWGPMFISQLYSEGWASRDLLGYYYNNLQEFRLGLRQKFSLSSLSFALSLHRAFGSYTGQAYRDPNPYGLTYSEWKGLLVVGAQL